MTFADSYLSWRLIFRFSGKGKQPTINDVIANFDVVNLEGMS